ncbi:DUF6153 family protein [Arthrobacter sp. ISL-28]|uniref:DUF6153 family protein n=1 Tax=Arthrobacter sp. ISL-28 TaxID=2819108 RepID=UPI001BEA0B6D|nr:DUF6153 family protein [Arthrobacter sp. ISL-28]MBT2520069.1 hypothetical protein [Arthrobacter sp. ISL-28]
MTATAKARATAFLRHAGLLAAVLAVIAGIFGMHVITGTHAMHSPAATGGTAHAAPSGDHGHPAPETVRDHLAPAAQGTASVQAENCSGSGGGASMQTMTAACTPSAKTGSLTAPLPGTAVFAIGSKTGDAAKAIECWSYLPGSPTPGELSISRT